MIHALIRIAIEALTAISNKMDDEEFSIRPVDRIRLEKAITLLKEIKR